MDTSNLLIVIYCRNFSVYISLPFLRHLTFMATFFYKYSAFLVSMNLLFLGAACNLLTFLALFLFVGFFYALYWKCWYSPDFIHNYYFFYSVFCSLLWFQQSHINYWFQNSYFQSRLHIELQIHISIDDLWASQSQHISKSTYLKLNLSSSLPNLFFCIFFFIHCWYSHLPFRQTRSVKVFIVQGWKMYDTCAAISSSHAYYRHTTHEHTC